MAGGEALNVIGRWLVQLFLHGRFLLLPLEAVSATRAIFLQHPRATPGATHSTKRKQEMLMMIVETGYD
jgi:hypothetical protein